MGWSLHIVWQTVQEKDSFAFDNLELASLLFCHSSHVSPAFIRENAVQGIKPRTAFVMLCELPLTKLFDNWQLYLFVSFFCIKIIFSFSSKYCSRRKLTRSFMLFMFQCLISCSSFLRKVGVMLQLIFTERGSRIHV